MPGENPLPIDCQVDFQQDIVAMFNIGTTLTDAYVYFCERETVVDFACVAATVGDTDCNFTLRHCAVAADGSITAVDSGTAFTNELAVFESADVPNKQEFTITPTANVIPANSYIALSGDAASSSAGVLQLRLRTKRR